jgi:hypothetical protein
LQASSVVGVAFRQAKLFKVFLMGLLQQVCLMAWPGLRSLLQLMEVELAGFPGD